MYNLYMKYCSVKEIAKKWNISERSVRNYCKNGRIPGLTLKGKAWLIPSNASFPLRKRKINSEIFNCLIKEAKSKISGGLYHVTQIDFAYNSNHIEGSKLTHDQTRYIFETTTIGLDKDKTIRVNDIIETVNHFKCFEYLLKTINKVLDHNLIKSFHRILKSNTTDSNKEWFRVGDYKTKPNFVGESKTSLPENVFKDMTDLLNWYHSLKAISFNDIVEFHVKFEKIHPFQDGNGRIGRIIMFRECLRNNIVPFIIKDDVRLFYYRGLKEWNKQKGYLIDTCLKCQDDYKKILEYLRIKY